MLDAIRDFFASRIADRPDDTPESAEHRARIAAAALLVEAVRSDAQAPEAERAEMLRSVQRKFGLEQEEAARLLALAEAEASEAHDLYQFTSQVNAHFAAERKLRLVEELWRVAWADGVVHMYEEHLIRRVADLLHVPHSAFIRAKLRAQESLQR